RCGRYPRSPAQRVTRSPPRSTLRHSQSRPARHAASNRHTPISKRRIIVTARFTRYACAPLRTIAHRCSPLALDALMDAKERMAIWEPQGATSMAQSAHTRVEAALGVQGVGEAAGSPWSFETSQSAHTCVEAALGVQGVGEAAGSPWSFETSQSAHTRVEAALGVQGVGEAGRPPWPPDSLHLSARFQAARQQGEPPRQHVPPLHHGRLLRREGVLQLCWVLTAWAAVCIASAGGLAGDRGGLRDCADILAAGVALTPTTASPATSAPPSSTSDSNKTSSTVDNTSTVDSTSPNSTASSRRAGEWGHHRRYERRAGECWSRAELPCYAGISRHTRAQQEQQPGEENTDGFSSKTAGQNEQQQHGMSEQLQVKLRQYHTYRRECLHREPLHHLRSTLLTGKPTSCRYLVFYHPSDGQGNRLISLVSAFAYALLTDRIFLLSSKSGLAAVLCEPFEHGESWVLFGREEKLEEHHAQVLRVKVAREWREVRQGREKMGKKGGGRRRLVEGLRQQKGRAKYHQFYEWTFFTRPLPPPFRSLSRLLLFPRNRIWAQLTHRFHTLIAPAPARIGLQGRFPTHANEGRLRYDTVNMGRCLLDALNSSVLQEAREMRLGADWEEGGQGRGVVEGAGAAEGGELGRVFASSGSSSSSSSGSGGSGDDYGIEELSGNVTEVMVASLNAALVHNLSAAVTGNVSAVRVSVGHDATHAAMGVILPPINTNAASPALPAATPAPTSPDVANSSSSNSASDTHVHIVRLTIDEKQNNGDKAGVDRAMVDIYTLALFSDALVISEVSTFGYLCASLFGVPRTTFVSATCKRAPPEPCLHFPPKNERCPDGQAQVLEQVLAQDPHVPLMHCVDVKNGLTLKPLEGWE
ncbi:unnamed protein product, partial [Closterium sp. Naga37s-1]